MMPRRLEGDQHLVVRTDGGPDIGAGHVMRCLALAQAWQSSRGRVVFLMAANTPELEERLLAERIEVVHLAVSPGNVADITQTVTLARELRAPWVVLDGYNFDDGYQKAIKDAGLNLLLVDDYGHAGHYHADLVVNQNIGADQSLYLNHEPYTRLLLGTKYALLRHEYLPWMGRRHEIPALGRKVLVTLGGGDFHDLTGRVIQALQQVGVDELEVVIVVGGARSLYEKFEAIHRHSSPAIRLKHGVRNMAELMAWADVAVSGGGSTCWELAFMGLPALVLILADNQRAIAQGLDEAGVVVNLGWHEDLTATDITQALVNLAGAPDERVEMSRRGRELVDGKGNDRVLGELLARCSS